MTALTWDDLEWGDHVRLGNGQPGELDTSLTYTVARLERGPERVVTLIAYSAAQLVPVRVRLTPRLLRVHQVTRSEPWNALTHALALTFRITPASGPSWIPPLLEVSVSRSVETDFEAVGVMGPQGQAAFHRGGGMLTHWTLREVASRRGWPLSLSDEDGVTSVNLKVDSVLGPRVLVACGENEGRHDAVILARAVRLACELVDAEVDAEMDG